MIIVTKNVLMQASIAGLLESSYWCHFKHERIDLYIHEVPQSRFQNLKE